MDADGPDFLTDVGDREWDDLLAYCAERTGLSRADCARVIETQTDFWIKRVNLEALRANCDDDD